MKTTAIAINKVVSILASGLNAEVFKYSKPTSMSLDEYMVVNSLPIRGDVMQECTVNVNYHVKDLADGIPNVEKLEAGSDSVIALLEKVDDPGTVHILIDIDRDRSQETFRNEALKEHYSNMRFKVKIINK